MRLSFRPLLLALGAALIGAQASAQTVAFTLDQPNCNFSFSGTSSVGAIVGSPSTFQMLGTQNITLALQAGAQPFASLAFAGGSVTTSSTLHATVGGFLATIDLAGLALSATSPVATVGVGGAFSATVTFTALSGTLTVDPLIGSTTVTDLTGSTSLPTAVSGNLTVVGGKYHLVAPINTSFAFSDPGSGVSGNITLVGQITADFEYSRPFCFGDGSGTACPCANTSPVGQKAGCLNSTGVGGKLVSTGIPSIAFDTLVLNGTQQPATTVGLYFQGNGQINAGAGAVFGDGLRCVTTTVIRLGTKNTVAGASSYPDVGDPSVSVKGLVVAPGTKHYQLWYRNAAAFCNAETFNLTNGLTVTWLL
jgi:hypothetical protein